MSCSSDSVAYMPCIALRMPGKLGRRRLLRPVRSMLIGWPVRAQKKGKRGSRLRG